MGDRLGAIKARLETCSHWRTDINRLQDAAMLGKIIWEDVEYLIARLEASEAEVERLRRERSPREDTSKWGKVDHTKEPIAGNLKR